MGERWQPMGKPLHWPSAESMLRGDPPVDPATLPKPGPANELVVSKVDHEQKRIVLSVSRTYGKSYLSSASACHGKQAFERRTEANRAAARRGGQVFRCKHCRKWHLASGGRRAMT